MTLKGLVRAVLLAEAFAVATFGLGWWSVPIVAAVWAAFFIRSDRARLAALCAALGWATLLLIDFARGPVATMATQLGGVMRLPPIVLYVLTLIFPALLAWSSATIVSMFRKPAV